MRFLSRPYWVAFALVTLTPISGAQAQDSGSSPSVSFNPSISAHGLFWAGAAWPFADLEVPFAQSEEHAHGGGPFFQTGLGIREIELALSASVDPVFRAELFIAWHGALEPPEIEEFRVATLSIPQVRLSVGRLRLPAGRHNSLHQHARPFLNVPLVVRGIYGDEGLSEIALQVDWLMPLPWYSELSAAVANGDHERLFGGGSKAWDVAGFARWHNEIELGRAGTLDLAPHALVGRNAVGGTSWAAGAELTLKLRNPHRQREQGLAWLNEFHIAYVHDEHGDLLGDMGFTSGLRGQLTRNLWLGGRGGVLWEGAAAPAGFGVDVIAAWAFSHTSVLQLQYSLEKLDGETSQAVQLQLNVSIGSHPAHAY